MQRVVIDTNVYIDWINEGQYEAVLFQRDSVKYLSAVVIMELSAGAFSVRDRRGIGAGSGRFTLTHKHPFISANGRAGSVSVAAAIGRRGCLRLRLRAEMMTALVIGFLLTL